ncbi:MAG: prepilin-type N-terminal cleavage/methylation domain-containing protein [Candidatus Peribacteraceae bacterium]|nr:prepilin-type N-terminal cleavage/methylation domain-containing protein [Candidatus Peribacteraceae bacterium]
MNNFFLYKSWQRKKIFRNAFTLPEIIITIALFGIMASLSIPYLGDFYKSENIGSHCKNIRQTIYRASTRSIAGEQGLPWGVYAAGNEYTLFAGETYISRNTALDETFTLPGGMSFLGNKTFIFHQFSGIPISAENAYIIFDGETSLCASMNESGLVE